jgi:hypothetical protein
MALLGNPVPYNKALCGVLSNPLVILSLFILSSS